MQVSFEDVNLSLGLSRVCKRTRLRFLRTLLYACGVRSALSLHVCVHKRVHSGAQVETALGICEATLSMFCLGGEIYSRLQ